MAYALVALGFVLALNAAGAVNFAHGDLVVLGGMVAVLLAGWLQLPGLAAAAGGAGARGCRRAGRPRRDPAARPAPGRGDLRRRPSRSPR
jgi:branched-chain amino acid transport system permease protein